MKTATDNYVCATYDKPPHGRLHIKSWMDTLMVMVWCDIGVQHFNITTLPEERHIALLECVRSIVLLLKNYETHARRKDR